MRRCVLHVRPEQQQQQKITPLSTKYFSCAFICMSDTPDHVVRHFGLCVPSDFVTFCPTRSPACGRMAFILKLLVSRHAYVTCSPAGDDRFSLNRPTSPNKLRFYHVRDIHVCSTYDRMCFVRIIFCWTEIVRWQLPVLTCLCID